ncbi:MAG: helix-turn-helix domain-containing protein [Oscillibacter sp.]|nr:helix-turn-helix domain-containing protein [Oscillibacter sp.]
MKIKYLNEVVRQRRKELNVSQRMVCEGLCATMTLSRFESGQQTPSWSCAAAILQRLELPDEQIFAQLTREETRLVLLRKEILASCGRFEQTLGEEREQARMQILEKLRDLERCIKKDDRINQQFFQMSKIIVGLFAPQNRLEMLMETIRLTSPRFDLNDISKCLYCSNEVMIINQIGRAYSDCAQPKIAVNIYEQLMTLVLNRAPNHEYLPLIAYNYARCLVLENRMKEALEISELGRQICTRQEHYYLLPKFLHVEAECLYFTGEADSSRDFYRSAYHIYGALANTSDQEILKYAAKKYLNLLF